MEIDKEKKEKYNSQASKQARDIYLDVLRGIAILIVVWGHSIQVCQGDFNNPVHLIIQSFQMALLMVISGYTIGYSEPIDNILLFIKKKIFRLFIPYLIWEQIHYFLNIIVENGQYSLYEEMASVLNSNFWFLRILFIMYMLYALFQWTTKECYRLKVKNMKILLEIMSAIGCIIIALELSKINGFEELRSYIFFFVLGIIWFRIKDKISKEIIKMISGMSLVVFIGLCIAFFEISNLMVHKIINKLLGLVGTIVISGCVKCIINKNRDWKCWKYIAKIGKNTLPIYAIHWCLLFSTNTFPYSNIAGEVHSIYILSIVVWLEWTIISIFLAKIFEKNKYSRILLLGLK